MSYLREEDDAVDQKHVYVLTSASTPIPLKSGSLNSIMAMAKAFAAAGASVTISREVK